MRATQKTFQEPSGSLGFTILPIPPLSHPRSVMALGPQVPARALCPWQQEEPNPSAQIPAHRTPRTSLHADPTVMEKPFLPGLSTDRTPTLGKWMLGKMFRFFSSLDMVRHTSGAPLSMCSLPALVSSPRLTNTPGPPLKDLHQLRNAGSVGPKIYPCPNPQNLLL